MNEQLKLPDDNIKELAKTSKTGLTKEKEQELIKYIESNQPEVYWDYRDELGEEYIKKIFKDTSSVEKIEEGLCNAECELYDNNLSYIWELESNAVDETIKEFGLEEHENVEEIKDFLRDYVQVDMNYDKIISKGTVNVVIRLMSNYDCQSSNWYTEQSGGYEYGETYFKDMLDVLNINPAEFKKKAIERNNSDIGKRCTTPQVQGRFPNLKHRTGKELVDIKSLLVELENNSSPSLLTFVCEYSVDEAIELFKQKEKAKYIKIKKGTMCGLFSSWEGGGSVLELDVINPDLKIKLSKDKYTYLDMDVEGNVHRYSIDDVCGLVSTAFQGGGFELC